MAHRIRSRLEHLHLRRPTARALAPLALALLTAACDPAPKPMSMARDSAGIRVVENLEPAWSPEERWRLGEPTLDLGGSDAEAPTAFQWITSAFLTDSGPLVVVESGGDVHIFDRQGRHLRTAGGSGDGPGEFRMVAGAGARGDTIWAYDYSHRRLTYFGLDGELGSIYTLEGDDRSLMPVGPLVDGVLLAGTYLPGAAAADGRLGLRRDTVPYRVFGWRGQRGPALGVRAGREYVVRQENGRLTMATPIFARRAHDATGDSLWVHGDQSSRSIQVHGPDGQLRTIIRWPGPHLAVTDAAVRGEIERRIRQLTGDEAANRRFFSELQHLETRPAHGRIHVDTRGRVWVGTVPGPADDGPLETPGWHVFDPDGRWLGTVPDPGRFRITQILDDRVVGVWRDALDVQHVQIRPILFR